MIKLYEKGIYLLHNQAIVQSAEEVKKQTGKTVHKETAEKGTMAYGIMEKHNTVQDMTNLELKFDAMCSHDITYVGVIQTARASGMTKFPVPYVLTNCHNSLCAVGGTINEDDHKFALSAAHKYGGIYVPPNVAVCHSFDREMVAGCGKMVLSTDSHTRYGALGTMGVGEGGGEIAKQLLEKPYCLLRPQVIAVYLTGSPRPGVGPHDVALSICGATYKNGYTKNKVMEFVGPGIKNLPVEYRNSIDVMTTETTCWSSIWTTDAKVEEYLAIHGRPTDYKEMHPAEVAYYDGCIYIDLSTIECTIALPMHPSYTYTIKELLENPKDIFHMVEARANEKFPAAAQINLVSKVHSDGNIYVEQGIVAGCSGSTFDNLCAVAKILKGHSCGNGAFSLDIYPGSLPAYSELLKHGEMSQMIDAGAILKTCFCGPCFGAGDTPANGELSIRHTTRNFPNREGSKPGEGQIAAVALMDARSIAATAINKGKLTPATDLTDIDYSVPKYYFNSEIYAKRVYNGWGHAEPETPLQYGPNIKDWPEMPELTKDLLVKVCAYITDGVTTTDELMPSGETSSYRSNPERLSEFTLSRRIPEYVGRSKVLRQIERDREEGKDLPEEVIKVYGALEQAGLKVDPKNTEIGSTIFANMPGDGSAREQAASGQRIMGGAANFAKQYATKRYRSNCINWGMAPFLVTNPEVFALGDYIYVPNIKENILQNPAKFTAYAVKSNGEVKAFDVALGNLNDTERDIITSGSLINYYKKS